MLSEDKYRQQEIMSVCVEGKQKGGEEKEGKGV